MIIVLLADGFEEIEALTPVDMLRRAGQEVKTVGISGKNVTGSHGITVVADAEPAEIDLSAVTLAVFPGGMPGATNLDASPYTDEVIRAVVRNGGRLAAICAAPLVFGRRGLLDGKTATCFEGFEKELRGAIISKRAVVTDGMITTASGMPAAYKFAEELVRLVEDKKDDKKDEIIELDLQSTKEDEAIAIDPYAKEIATRIIDTLACFNVKADIKLHASGPRFYQFALVPAKGVKVNAVSNLFSDIQLNLGIEGMRMEVPMPGKSAIGIEVPKKCADIVLTKDLWNEPEYSDKPLTCIPLGKSIGGETVYMDIMKLPHLLIAGATGMGKSVISNTIITSLARKCDPSQLKMILIDPKKVEYTHYSSLPQLLCPVISDIQKAVGALKWAVEEMERRYDLLQELEVSKIDSYNQKVSEDPSLGSPLAKIVIFIDELSDLMIMARKPAEDYIMSIAQKARAAGIFLVIGTQRPSVDVLTGVIKANIPSRISCKVASYNDSRTILEAAGAEKLLNNGDALYFAAGYAKPMRVQTAFISDGEIIEAVADSMKKYGAPNFIDIPDYTAPKAVRDDDFEDEEDVAKSLLSDDNFVEALHIAVRSGKIATSLLQRKLRIGYAKAACYIDYMEEFGFISPPNGSKPRDVLITEDELKAFFEDHE